MFDDHPLTGGGYRAIWTFDKIQTLTQLWADRSLTAREIAHRLGPDFNRNAVIGKAHRLHLERRAHTIAARYAAKMSLGTTERGNDAHARKSRPEPSLPLLIPQPMPRKAKVKSAPVEPDPAAFVGLMARTGCAFPMGNSAPYTFCNAPVADAPAGGQWHYCDHHRQIMFRSPAERAAENRKVRSFGRMT